jgi:hypothetical protein
VKLQDLYLELSSTGEFPFSLYRETHPPNLLSEKKGKTVSPIENYCLTLTEGAYLIKGGSYRQGCVLLCAGGLILPKMNCIVRRGVELRQGLGFLHQAHEGE